MAGSSSVRQRKRSSTSDQASTVTKENMFYKFWFKNYSPKERKPPSKCVLTNTCLQTEGHLTAVRMAFKHTQSSDGVKGLPAVLEVSFHNLQSANRACKFLG